MGMMGSKKKSNTFLNAKDEKDDAKIAKKKKSID
jgi:hypothetical protein